MDGKDVGEKMSIAERITCDNCKMLKLPKEMVNDGEKVLDPYALEINSEEVLVRLCLPCYGEKCGDI